MIAIRVLVALAGLGLAHQAEAQVVEHGYFKSSTNVRVFTFELKDSQTNDQVRKHAERLPHTSGKVTAAYYFAPGAKVPSIEVSRARDLFKVNEFLYESPGVSVWRYAYIQGPDGRRSFVDCQAAKGDSLCRPAR